MCKPASFFHSSKSNSLLQVNPCSENVAPCWSLCAILSLQSKDFTDCEAFIVAKDFLLCWLKDYLEASEILKAGGPSFISPTDTCMVWIRRFSWKKGLGFWEVLSLKWPHLILWFSSRIQIYVGTDLLRPFIKPVLVEQVYA